MENAYVAPSNPRVSETRWVDAVAVFGLLSALWDCIRESWVRDLSENALAIALRRVLGDRLDAVYRTAPPEWRSLLTFNVTGEPDIEVTKVLDVIGDRLGIGLGREP